jgi:nucleotide sugar dehydrogenase|tara:strand:+ start:144 stop:1277 length:1134 start_codon:yes stop_codon:yes gene_type:complete
MKIGLIGAGRLGICLALLMAEAGYEVLASDVREDYVHSLRNKAIRTTEPAVQELLERSHNIDFTTSNERVIKECEIIFTLVATPSLEDGSYDVSAVDDVVSDIQKYGWNNMDSLVGKSLVVGCTTNPGDCDVFQDKLSEVGMDVYYNPEFIAQGSIVCDLRFADMVLVGGEGHHRSELERIYEGIQNGYRSPTVHFMSAKAAELTKIAVNCFLTTKISYANMIGQVLSLSGMSDEIDTVLDAIGSDARIGKKYLGFGFGFGGPCFPRDNRAFAAYAQQIGVEHNIGTTTDNFNDAHTEFLKNYVIKNNPKKLPYCFKYLTYKRGIDIITESRPYDLAKILLDEGYSVYCIDDTMSSALDSRIKFVAAPKEDVYWIDL